MHSGKREEETQTTLQLFSNEKTKAGIQKLIQSDVQKRKLHLFSLSAENPQMFTQTEISQGTRKEAFWGAIPHYLHSNGIKQSRIVQV